MAVPSHLVNGNGPTTGLSSNNTPRIICGPLLNYKRTSRTTSGASLWHGSVLVVTKPGSAGSPILYLDLAGGVDTRTPVARNGTGRREIAAVKLYEDTKSCFWRFVLEVPFQDFEAIWTYSIENIQHYGGENTPAVTSRQFMVPAADQSMRIMFHSCNGFSVGTDEDAWSGPALWNDVVRVHDQKPFHVMIGGGDQIYNDGVRVSGPLNAWTAIGNPKKRRMFPFPEDLRDECDVYYFNNYVKWFSTQPFAEANGRIPQVNIWDDHGNGCPLNLLNRC